MQTSRARPADYAALPEYESGKFTLNADRLIKFAQKNGTGDFAKYKAFTFRGGKLIPVEHIDPIRLTDLKNYELQRNQVVENTIAFLNGLPAQNALLYGDRGCGKSSTIKAILNEYDQLRMIELPKAEIAGLGDLYAMLKDIPMHFIVTIDDLTFTQDDERFGILKATLDGSLSARPDNILIYATTNRRKLIKETYADRSATDVNKSDAVDREHVPCGSFRTVHHVHTAEPRDLFRHRKTACRGYGYRDRRQQSLPRLRSALHSSAADVHRVSHGSSWTGSTRALSSDWITEMKKFARIIPALLGGFDARRVQRR